MRVLGITLGLPDPTGPGAQVRDYQLYRRVAERHDVRLVALVSRPPDALAVRRLEDFCAIDTVPVSTALRLSLCARLPAHWMAGRPLATLPFVERSALSAIRTIADSRRPDVVQIEHSFLAPYVDAMRGVGAATVLSFHNVGSCQYARMFEVRRSVANRVKSVLMKNWEARWVRRFDAALVVSESDRALLGTASSLSEVAIVPNGVDIDAIRPVAPSPASREVLFVANLHYAPNRDGIEWFCRSVFPAVRREHVDAVLRVVGPVTSGFRDRLASFAGVRVEGRVADLEAWYAKAAVCIAPLRAGGGTRIKILEAMAFGRPVVATPLGAEGLSVQPGVHCLVSGTATGFAGRIVRLFRDDAARDAMVAAARRLVVDKYDWSQSAGALIAVYDRAVRRRAARSASRCGDAAGP